MIDVRASAVFICSHSVFVSIDHTNIPLVAAKILRDEFAKPILANDQQLVGSSKEETAMACFLLDSLNFGVDGFDYWSLVAALKQAFSENKNWLDPQFLSSVTADNIQNLFGTQQEISLLPKRRTAIQEIGNGLKGLGKRGAWTLVQVSQGSVEKFIDTILERFPLFGDIAQFEGEQIGFYKRAQLLVVDLQLMLAAHRITPFRDLKKLTAFADNALPQLLRDEGIFVYGDDLANRVDGGVFLESGSREEVEIRGNTIQAVELLRTELEKHRRKLTSAELDAILWTEATRRKDTMKPRHRTLTTNY